MIARACGAAGVFAIPPNGPALGRPKGVLITRPEPGSRETAARVAAMGLTAVVAPLLEIRPAIIRLPRPERIAAILLTSAHAAGPLPAAFHAHPVLTVGGATADSARAAGFSDAVSADGDAVALAALAGARLSPDDGPLLLASGRGQGLELAAGLRARGYRIVRRVVYAASPVAVLPPAAAAALMDDQITAVMFFSAETARHFTRLVQSAGLTGALRGREAITIGTRAAMALRGSDWSCVRSAGKPTQEEMLALLR